MKKSTQDKGNSLFSKWLHFVIFNYSLSIFPLALLISCQYIASFNILDYELVPDLLMVAFAVCVNIYNMAKQREKSHWFIKLVGALAGLAFLTCCGIYCYSAAFVAELGKQIDKFTIGYNESPEIAVEYAEALANYFKNQLNVYRWDILFNGAIAVLIVCAIFGSIMVLMSYHLEKGDAEALSSELHTLIKDTREKLSDKGYDELMNEIRKFQQETRVKMEKMVLMEIEENFAGGQGGESGE